MAWEHRNIPLLAEALGYSDSNPEFKHELEKCHSKQGGWPSDSDFDFVYTFSYGAGSDRLIGFSCRHEGVTPFIPADAVRQLQQTRRPRVYHISRRHTSHEPRGRRAPGAPRHGRRRRADDAVRPIKNTGREDAARDPRLVRPRVFVRPPRQRTEPEHPQDAVRAGHEQRRRRVVLREEERRRGAAARLDDVGDADVERRLAPPQVRQRVRRPCAQLEEVAVGCAALERRADGPSGLHQCLVVRARAPAAAARTAAAPRAQTAPRVM